MCQSEGKLDMIVRREEGEKRWMLAVPIQA